MYVPGFKTNSSISLKEKNMWYDCFFNSHSKNKLLFITGHGNRTHQSVEFDPADVENDRITMRMVMEFLQERSENTRTLTLVLQTCHARSWPEYFLKNKDNYRFPNGLKLFFRTSASAFEVAYGNKITLCGDYSRRFLK